MDKKLLYPIDSESRKKIVSSASKTAGLSFFSCGNGRRNGKIGKIESVGLGTITVLSGRKKYSLSLSVCTKIASTNS